MAKKLHPALKVAIIIGTVGVTGTLGYLAYRKFFRSTIDKTDPNPNTPETLTEIIYGNKPTNCRYCDKEASFPLKKGSRGKQVASAQYGHNVMNPNNKIQVDGDWGNKTEQAVFLSLQQAGVFPQGQSRPSTPIQISESTYNKYFKKYETI